MDASVHAPVSTEGVSHAKVPELKVDIDPMLEESLVPRRRGGLSAGALALIGAATAFGAVAAYVLVSKPPPQTIVVQTPAPTAATGAPAASAESPGQPQVAVGEITTAPTATVTRPASGGGKSKVASAPATPATPATPLDTSGFVNNVPGPAAAAPAVPAGGGSGQLSQGEMNGVVAQNKPRVTRKCWQPALEGQTAAGTKNARVSVSMTIGASGNVESASASGAEHDFPGLSSCIASMVKSWKFPPSGGSTSVNVPFVFAGQ